jgi:hypothetical protein
MLLLRNQTFNSFLFRKEIKKALKKSKLTVEGYLSIPDLPKIFLILSSVRDKHGGKIPSLKELLESKYKL